MQEIVIITYASVEGVWFICGQTTKRGPALFWLMFNMIGGKRKAVKKHSDAGEEYITISNDNGEKIESFLKEDYDYPWCASPLCVMNMMGRIKVFKRMIKFSAPLKANAMLFSAN